MYYFTVIKGSDPLSVSLCSKKPPDKQRDTRRGDTRATASPASVSGVATMPPVLTKDVKRDHDANRFRCCCLCLNESGEKASRPINDRVETIIRERVDGEFSLLDPRYGASLCLKCDIDINKLGKNKIETVYKSERFGEHMNMQLRSDSECKCLICSRATLQGLDWIKFRKQWKNKPGRPSTKNNVPASGDRRRCNTCFTEVRNCPVGGNNIFGQQGSQELSALYVLLSSSSSQSLSNPG